MQLNFASDQETVAVTIKGRITHATLDIGNDPLATYNPDIYKRRVLFDLSGVDYVDSSGVSWLLTCHKRFREAGGKLILHSITPLVMQVIRVLKLDQVFCIADSARAAREQMSEVTA
jgi:anti-anti-sigma factor